MIGKKKYSSILSMGSGQPPQEWGMALAKFLACAVPQFLQSRKAVKLLGLIRKNWAFGGGQGVLPGRGKRRGADGAKTASHQEKRDRGLQTGQKPGMAGLGVELGSVLEIGTGAESASQGWGWGWGWGWELLPRSGTVAPGGLGAA